MNGVVAINKSSGISSSDVVIKCRNKISKVVGTKTKCGHFGTLDPAACGVLLLGFGKSTRLFDYFLEKQKTYRAKFVFGKTTDTLDSFGNVVEESRLPLTSDVLNCLTSFVGEIMQIPPQYSAINIDGRRAYDLARQGKSVNLEAKSVNIFDINVVRIEQESVYCNSIELDIVCSSGTYIRSLCRDIAKSSHCVGYMSYLIRTECGSYTIQDACLIEEFLDHPLDYIQDTIQALSKIMPIVEVTEDRKKIINGVPVEIRSAIEKPYAITFDGKLFGIARNYNGLAKVVTNLWEE